MDKTQEAINKIEVALLYIMEGDERIMSNQSHDGEDGRYKDGFYDGVHTALNRVKEIEKEYLR